MHQFDLTQPNPHSPDLLQNNYNSQLSVSSIPTSIITPVPVERHATVPWTIVDKDGKRQSNVVVEEIVVKTVYHKGIFDSRLRDSMKLMDIYEEMVDEVCQNFEGKL